VNLNVSWLAHNELAVEPVLPLEGGMGVVPVGTCRVRRELVPKHAVPTIVLPKQAGEWVGTSRYLPDTPRTFT
jgi:hypothetical protein